MRHHGGVDVMTDGQLATLAQAGDQAAFGVLVRRWQRPLERFLSRLLSDEEAARDACQEALLKAWIHIRRLERPERFKSWLHQIAVNTCRDRQRTTRRRDSLHRPLDEVGDEALPDETRGPGEHVEARQLAGRVRAALARLTHEQREAIVLRELEGYTSPEVAALVDVPAATVRSRLYYGLRALRRELVRDGLAPVAGADGGE